MLKQFILCSCLLVINYSCSDKLNQYKKDANGNTFRNGKWKENYSSSDGELLAFGRYKKGNRVGVWKTYFENKIYQKEKIKNNSTKVKYYYPDGRIMQKGQTKLDQSEKESHWYYTGQWHYYNEQGKLMYIKNYQSGNKVDSVYVAKE